MGHHQSKARSSLQVPPSVSAGVVSATNALATNPATRRLHKYYAAGHQVAYLPKLSWYCLTAQFMCLATENCVISVPRWMTIGARISFPIAVFFSAVLFTSGIPAEEHWCCYGAKADIRDLDLGICTNNSAPIHTSTRFEPCTVNSVRPETWLIIGLTCTSVVVWLFFLLIRCCLFHRKLRRDLECDEKFMFQIVKENKAHIMHTLRRAGEEKITPTDVANVLIMCLGALDELNAKARTSAKAGKVAATKSALLLSRTKRFLVDPVSMLLGLPLMVLDAHAGPLFFHLLLNAIWVSCVFCMIHFSLPHWRQSCCYTKHTSTSTWKAMGHCDDPAGWAHRSEHARECAWNTLTWDLWVETAIGGVALLLAVAHYIAISVTYVGHGKIMVAIWLRAATAKILQPNSSPDLVASGGSAMRAALGKQFAELSAEYACPPQFESAPTQLDDAKLDHRNLAKLV